MKEEETKLPSYRVPTLTFLLCAVFACAGNETRDNRSAGSARQDATAPPR